MTHRERWLRTLRFQPVDRGIDIEFGAWEQTITRWHQEGLPEEYDGVWEVIPQYFKTDDSEWNPTIWPRLSPFPGFERTVLEIKGDHQIIQDEDGATCEMLRPELGASIPRYLRHAIETRQDWERIRDERLNPDAPERMYPEAERLLAESINSDSPVQLWCGSLYGNIRNWMGVENLSYAVYDDPEWVEEMMEHLTQLTLTVFSRITGQVKIDSGVWWEDMCYNHGPLLSPALFKELMVPRYKRITKFMREAFGCEHHFLDCDGNIHELAPLWLEAGINGMYPLEAPHTDAYRLRKEFGARMPLRGYVDKIALIEGPAAIDAEIERLRPLYEGGGFIPHLDHLVPPDVSWDNYCYYRKKKLELIGKEPAGEFS